MAYAESENNGSAIFRQRERSVDLLENVENLVNSIANHPKNFDVDFKEIHLYKKEFKDVCDYATQELDAAKKSMAGVGAGVAGGMVAISTLSGAAATNAALAWLGGGAAAAGGRWNGFWNCIFGNGRSSRLDNWRSYTISINCFICK